MAATGRLSFELQGKKIVLIIQNEERIKGIRFVTPEGRKLYSSLDKPILLERGRYFLDLEHED